MKHEAYRDRREAGRILADRMEGLEGLSGAVVLALPRGGVPVGYEVARRLKGPLDVFLVRKLGVPGHPELAFGAIATGGVRMLNRDVVDGLRISREVVDEVTAEEAEELARRESAYHGGRPPPEVRGKTAVLVDDGLATGASMRAAVAALRRLGPASIVVAVPVAAPSTVEEFGRLVDRVVCPLAPEPFRAVGLWYEDFSQTSDDEVRELLRRAEEERAGPSNPA
ncbi:phosphoribosyltransferase [Paludisphaera sp.]|uniref:phosphoribosyltransferase n=1 Tax=Paludisphaera sp. TaxID=2017432 RepID=UPI00301D2358